MIGYGDSASTKWLIAGIILIIIVSGLVIYSVWLGT
jgi:hypothetical protein